MTKARLLSLSGSSLSLALALAVVLLSVGCNGTLPPYNYKKEPDPRGMEYKIGIGDQLRVNVWKNSDLTTNATVRPDGYITMPLIGDLKAVEQTPTMLKKAIAVKLKKYYPEVPAVTVAVTAIRSYRFTVSGAFTRPGAFQPRKYITISEATALAGGLNRFASPEKCVVVRSKGGRIRRIPISMTMIQSGTRPDMDIVLLAGDTLHCPQ